MTGSVRIWIMTTALQKLHQLAERWGGSLVKVTEAEFEALDVVVEAPFANHLGVDYKAKKVYYTADEQMGLLIHEMGHVFASSLEPYDSDEWEFFGWEWTVARRVGCQTEWLHGTRDYGLEPGNEFGSLSEKEKQELLAERVAHGKTIGIIAKNGVPLCISP